VSIHIVIKLNHDSKGTLSCPGLGVMKCVGRYKEDYPKIKFPIVGKVAFIKNYHSIMYQCGVDGVGCLMEYAIRLDGRRGIYIHAWPNLDGESHGCIHLLKNDARQLFYFLQKYNRIWVTILKH